MSRASGSNSEKTFEIIDYNPDRKFIFIGGGAAVILVAVLLMLVVFKNEPQPAPVPPAAQAKPQAQPQQPQQAQPPAQAAEGRQDIHVLAKDPAQQAQVDQQMQEFLYYIQNPSIDDAVITVEWLSGKFNQPPEVVIRDVKVLTDRLAGLNDEQLAAFFASTENPWLDDPAYNNLIKLITHREYVGFVSKCADLYAREKLGRG